MYAIEYILFKSIIFEEKNSLELLTALFALWDIC
jgi:hypothetical protein